MKTKRILCLLLCFLFAISLLTGLELPVRAEEEHTGTCGEGLTWTLNSDESILTISGEGDMADYSATERAPWYDLREDIWYVTVDEGVTGLGSYAFDGCYYLESVSLPASLARVGDENGRSYVFRGCCSLEKITVDDANETFYDDDGVLLGNATIYRYPPMKTDEYYCIPEDISACIKAGAFEDAEYLERVFIPEITSFCFPIFEGCNSLMRIYFAGDDLCGLEDVLRADPPCEGVTILSGATAEDCKYDTATYSCGENVRWKVRDGTLTISGAGPMADYGEYHEEDDSWTTSDPPWWDWNPDKDQDENREQITRLVVEEGVTTVGAGAFRDLRCLESVSLPSTLTAIGGLAFANDGMLKKMAIPEGVVIIGDMAFSNSALEEIDLPESIATIDLWAFTGSCLKEIDLPENLKTIGSWAFAKTPLERVEIPAAVISIGERAFYECFSLKEFAVDETNTVYKSIGGALFTKDGTEMISYGAGHTAASFTVPDGVKKLHPSTFSYTVALEEVLLPDSLEEIDNWAFGHTGLKKVLVPPHVSVIQFNAFGFCENLESVTLPARLTTLEDWAFAGSEALKDIYFEGTEEQWAALTKGHEETLEGITIHYRFDAYCPHEKLIHRPAVPHGCLTDGTIEHWECEACGGCFSDAAAKNWLDDLRDPAGHDYRSAVTLTPTCSEAGVRTWTCAVCAEGTEGHSYTEPIPATGRHHFVDGYCDNVLQDGVTLCGAPEKIAGGTLENGMTWTIDSGGMLHIMGEGALPDVSITSLGNNRFTTSAPWFSYSNVITAVRLHSGVTSIGNACFAGLNRMKSLYVPVSLTDMSEFWTFFECTSLTDVYYEGTQEQWSSVHKFSTNLIEIRNPFGSGMLKIVDYIGRTKKHYGFDPDRAYTVIWRNADGTVLKTEEGVLPGTQPVYDGETPAKESTAQYVYVFEGWTPEPVSVTEDTVFTARFREVVRTYAVTWRNADGTVLETDASVPYGTTPEYNGDTPSKEADAQYTYTFAGWSPAVAGVTGETSYTATYSRTLNQYTVSFDAAGHGTAPAAQTVAYGSPAADPGPLTEEGWVFEGWQLNGETYDFSTAVTGPVTLTAKWTEVRTGITAVSAGEGTEPGKLPAAAESFTVEATVTLLDRLVTEDRVRICMVSYDGEGRFLKMECAVLARIALNTYTAKAQIRNDGDVATLKIFILDKGTWDPMADSRKLEK